MINQLKQNPLFQVELDYLDVLVWLVVIGFFGINALWFHGNVKQALLGAGGIIGLMLLVTHSINLILRVLSRHPKLGEITGYVTNGPEALVMIVGIINAKLGFAMGVPLGSNFANPALWVIALLITRQLGSVLKLNLLRVGLILLTTMTIAGLFFQLQTDNQLLVWSIGGLALSVFCYLNKGSENEAEDAETIEPIATFYLVPAILLLIVAGYFLDPAVALTAENSKVPEGVISFVVLSLITSWPEFRSATSLLQLNQPQAAVMNILVSNITNLWLAIGGTLIYILYY